ncbi:MAG: Gfo/Idh/MocA family oxidoreductase [Spirochaetales bacterium]|jgi:predicted dehydrogenase|nr:Gfo/Idh/MocA family oxidoreductase [Spirochaetales bacterium]
MNFGIIGTGMIAEFHYKAISEIPGCKVAACMDTIGERSRAYAEKHGCAAYDDLEKFLAHPGLEIVTICTPSGTHREPALAAAKAGKHLIVEKPIEVTLQRIDEIIAACDANNVSLSGVFMSRYHEAAQTLKKAIDAGRFGRLTLGSAYVKWWRSQEYYDKGGWRGTKKFDGGGALMNQGIHAIDLLQWFMGPVESVRAYTALLGHERIEVEDVAAASIRFKNGALGIIEGSTAAYPGFPKRIEISGVAGTAILEEESLKSWQFAGELPEDSGIREKFLAKPGSGGAADPSAIGYHGHKAQFSDIAGALSAGKKPLIDGHEARKAVEIILAIYRSAETGEEVKLPLCI